MKKTGKLLITMLTVAVLMAVFCVSASAADGLTESTACTTFEELTAALTAAPAGSSAEPTTIYVSGEITVSAMMRAEIAGKCIKVVGVGEGAVLKATQLESGNFGGGIFRLNDNTELTIENLTINANAYKEDGTGVISRYCILMYGENAKVTLNNGAVLTGAWRGVDEDNDWPDGGAVYMGKNGAEFIMNAGSSITGNITATTANNGAAIALGNGTFTMNGGTISGNTSAASGGAVYIKAAGEFIMNGGTISDNTARNGGGVYIDTGCSFTMYGGTIDSNNALHDSGGGVFVKTGASAYLYGGAITNNKSNYGWAIWMAGGASGGEVFIKDAVNLSGNARHESFESGGNAVGKSGSSTHNYVFKIDWDADFVFPSSNTWNSSFPAFYSSDLVEITVLQDVELSTRIYIHGYSESVSKEFKIIGANLGTEESPVYPVIKRASGVSMTDSFIGLLTYATLTLENITIDANGYSGTYGSPTRDGNSVRVVILNNNTQLVLNNNAVLKNGYATGAGAGVSVYGTNAKLTMNAGSMISECITTNANAGGVYVRTATSTFIMNGGTINSCKSTSESSAGGGVYIANAGATFVMNDGTISNCSATGSGGGALRDVAGATVVINKGTFSGNKAYSGGAIRGYGNWYVGEVTFTDNNASNVGGAIRMDANSTLILNENAVFSGNTAKTGNDFHFATVDCAVEKIWAKDKDLAKDSTYWSTTDKVYEGYIDRYVVKVTDDIETAERVVFGGTVPISVTGENIGTTEAPVYPTITLAAGTTGLSVSFVGLNSNTEQVTLSNITFDANIYDPAATEASEVSLRTVFVNPGSTLILESGAVITGGHRLSGKGGGIGVERATLIMNEGSSVTGNFADQGGGGVYIYGNSTVRATFTMNGGSISGNTGADGGGVYVYQYSTFELKGGTVSGNTATARAGGIFLSNWGKMSLSGAPTVTGNTLNGKDCNVQMSSGVMSFDDTVYASNPNYTAGTGWLTVNGEFTGSVGIYFPAISIGTNYAVAKFGILESGGSVAAGSLFNDNGYYTYTESTSDIDGAACVAMQADDPAYELTINYANGGSAVFTTVKFDAYVLPSYAELVVAGAAPDGCTESSFAGYIAVTGFNTETAKADAIYAADDEIALEDFADIYATWVKVTNLGTASVKVPQSDSDTTGLKLFATVDADVLAKVGINVMAANDSGDGFYRGMLLGTSASDLTGGLTETSRKMDVTVNNSGWANAGYGAGDTAFCATISYSANSANYDKAVAYCGYIVLKVGGKDVKIFAEYNHADNMGDDCGVVYADGTHVTSACATIRKVYFYNSKYPNAEAVIAAVGNEDNYNRLLAIAGLSEFPTTDPAAATTVYYL